jgi:predicted esterase
MESAQGPHQDQPLLQVGVPIEEAKAAMVMLHGRGASPQDILGLVPLFDRPEFTYLAPQAARYTWYSYSFLSPIEANEPGLSSALAVIDGLLTMLADKGLPPERVILLGFSQGACLSLEYAARHARRYGGLAGLSGGLIGPEDTPREYPGSLAGTPVFLGCSDIDPHIPQWRVEETAQVMLGLRADVNIQIYPGMGHMVNQDEIEAVREMMAVLLSESA